MYLDDRPHCESRAKTVYAVWDFLNKRRGDRVQEKFRFIRNLAWCGFSCKEREMAIRSKCATEGSLTGILWLWWFLFGQSKSGREKFIQNVISGQSMCFLLRAFLFPCAKFTISSNRSQSEEKTGKGRQLSTAEVWWKQRFKCWFSRYYRHTVVFVALCSVGVNFAPTEHKAKGHW